MMKTIKKKLKKIRNKIIYNNYRRLSLADYGQKNNTDKINKYHSFAGKNYLDIYSRYLNPLRESKIKMLEIGIRDGASLRTFRDFFKYGEIIGLDINPDTYFEEPRIRTYVGSQASPEIIDEIFKDHAEISIVLDDGSHVNELTLKSFYLIFNKLPKGSYYIIEDLACTYLEENLETDIKTGGWPGMDLNEPSLKLINKRSDMDSFFQCILKDLDFAKGEIEFVHFWSQVCIIKKID